jgi:glycosyltransferase involved in cell wall biosynthesis
MLRLFGATFLVHTHAAENAMFHTWVPRGVRRLLLWGFTGARRIVVLTQFWRAYYARIFTKPLDRFILLPNPSDLPASTPDRTGRKQLNLLFLGRIGERKGAFDLIEAFASLPEGLAGALRLTLAGDGDVDQARALAARTGCAARTSVLGWVSATQVVELLESADALLLPSRGEGMSIALLEALGAGLPVVTTRAGGTEDFIEHGRNGLLLEPGNLPAIRAAMCQLATDPALRERLGREARHTALGFSIERYVATLTSVYEQIASGGDGAVPAHFLGWSQPPSPGSGNPAA